MNEIHHNNISIFYNSQKLKNIFQGDPNNIIYWIENVLSNRCQRK